MTSDSIDIETLRKKYHEGIPTKCQRCGYPWLYSGSEEKRERIYTNEYPVFAVCPRCRTSVRIKIPEYFPEVTVKFEDIPPHKQAEIERFNAPDWADAIDRLILRIVRQASRKNVTLTAEEVWHSLGPDMISCDEVTARLRRLVDAKLLEKEACEDFEVYWSAEEEEEKVESEET